MCAWEAKLNQLGRASGAALIAKDLSAVYVDVVCMVCVFLFPTWISSKGTGMGLSKSLPIAAQGHLSQGLGLGSEVRKLLRQRMHLTLFETSKIKCEDE